MNTPNGSELKRWEAALREDGASVEEVARTVPILRSVASLEVPVPALADTEILLAKLESAMREEFGHVRRTRVNPAGLVQNLATVLAVARAQLAVFPVGFWIASGVVMLVGVALIGLGLDPSRSLIFYMVGPLLAFLGMQSAFQGTSLGVLELELACPTSPRQLTLARLVVMLGYQVPAGLLLSGPLWVTGGPALLSLTLTWLAPLLLASGLTLILSLRISMPRAAAVVYALWMVAVLGSWRLNGPEVSVGIPVEAAMAAGGLVLLGATIALLTPETIRWPRVGSRVTVPVRTF
jgi:hypothetical protein